MKPLTMQRPNPLQPELEYLIRLQRPAATLQLREGYPRALMAGGHLSRFQGRGIEFDEVRPYQPGDDIRSMDWRVTARTGKPHTKLFREERERPALLLLDMRPAMFFATRGALKAVIAAECATLLAWSIMHHGDRVGSMLFDASAAKTSALIRPGRGKRSVMRLLGNIVNHPQWQQRTNGQGASLFSALQKASHAALTGSMLMIVSDGRGIDEACVILLRQLLKHHNIVFVLVYDQFEAEMTDVGLLQASDGYTVKQADTASRAVRNKHSERFAERRDALQRLDMLPGFFLIECATTDDPYTALQTRLGISR
ncbi:hypothetical protein MMIC_P1077 [Mariprofundus micogutta]|uniref:DUF58 domain-containing protein n=1 Tax=Mariprofundus micogutta TaxID=1921010 RepID=A0A1L8CMI6_9PROT|nr:DUF58 domain-containing protein [Mariprofundus micogutta]GAV20115.1 hypothetical protein MMIC_P1077 [Mariprofundus micogutta]